MTRAMILLAAAALATAPSIPRSGARVEAVARATIVSGTTTRTRALPDPRQPRPQTRERPCETAAPCRLIVIDIP